MFLIIILILVAALTLWLESKRAVFKGAVGEESVGFLLQALPSSDYTTLNDVILYVDDNGHTVQIDHIVVSTYGVFVIETKNYKGKIYGSESVEYWHQYLGNNSYELRNPIIQNQAHARALQKIFKQYGDIHIFPIVVFVGSAKLKIEVNSPVVSKWGLMPEILKHRTYFLMPQQRETIIRLIDMLRLTDDQTKKNHIRDVKQKAIMSETAVRNGKCPRCGADLVLRYGHHGSFYGCSNYPRCKFSVDK